jgi:hypothetical protein
MYETGSCVQMGRGTIRVGLPSGSSVEVKLSVVVGALARESPVSGAGLSGDQADPPVGFTMREATARTTSNVP